LVNEDTGIDPELAPLLSMLVQSKSQNDLLLINMLVAGVMELASVSVVPEVLDSYSSDASRIDAWANGGANDICPAGFSVPTEAELTADTMSASVSYSSIINKPDWIYSGSIPVSSFTNA
jgi:hypothetical protein